MIPIPLLGLDDIMRFWLYVKRGSEAECWLWEGGCTYNQNQIGKLPTFRVRKEHIVAYRISYYIHNNMTDPGELLVCHECDNPLCMNPKHLFLGNQSLNQKDSHIKGRREGLKRKKLNITAVKLIWKWRGEGMTLQAIADKLNVSKTSIHKVTSGQRYTDDC